MPASFQLHPLQELDLVRDTLLPLHVTDRETTYRCPFMEITHQRADFGSFAKEYFVVNFRRRGGVVALRDGNALLVKQYRFLINAASWELPGGTIDDDENLEEGLARECVEETGVRPKLLERLVEYYPGLDNVDNRTTIFLSEHAETVAPFQANPSEVTEIAWTPLPRCLEMIFNGEILDAMTIAGLLACDHARRRNK
jgi:ADP-ribose pyrophosphatase